MQVRRVAAALALAACVAPAAGAEPWIEGRVVAVQDGDTFDVRVEAPADDGADVRTRTRRIRVAGIDTPERGQPWAERSKQALAKRIFAKEVRVNEVTTDAYGRTVGEVYADGVCVGCELVREGHAWVYRRFTDDPVLLRLEEEARAARRGLWSLPESQRVPPWRWRRAHARPHRARRAAPAPFERTCDARRTCREMTSCAEARFHLEQCGLGRLDGDGDGVPCESLCGEEP